MDALSDPVGRAGPGPAALDLAIGVYGGSFNPPHSGHAHVAQTALARFGLDRVWVLVSPQNPLKPSHETAPFGRRLDAARAAMAGPRIAISDFEARIGARYTVQTVAALKRRYPRARFVLIMGADAFAGLHRWRDWRALADLVPIGVVSRAGWTLRAGLSPAGRRARRVSPRRLKGTAPPAWSYAAAPFNMASSTALRARD